MDSACPKVLAIQILSDSDHSTKVAPTTISAPLTSSDSKRTLDNDIKNLISDLFFGIFKRTLSIL